MKCPTELVLIEYIEKKLDEWQEYTITNHLCKCDKCLDAVIAMTVHSKKEKKVKAKVAENKAE